MYWKDSGHTGADMRVGLLRVYSMLLNAVECGKLSSNSNVLDLIQTAVSISHILYSPPNERTPTHVDMSISTYMASGDRRIDVKLNYRIGIFPCSELLCMSRRLHITSTGKKRGSLQGRTIGEEEGSLRPLRSNKEDPR